MKLCWKIYKTFVITNNDFVSWVVKGYIVEEKGHDVNWAIANVYMAKGKAWKVKAMAFKFEVIEMSVPHTT